ncbi:MAG: hypothetical protein U5R06_08775 [candidate division KSB1 bacterium]|nr:hypothetical protein [candidate division KSB1 bacterium]
MKSVQIMIPCILLLFSCTEFIAEPDLDDNWQLAENGPIRLYTKPAGAGDAPSPNQQQINTILENQLFYYQAIQDSIQRSFKDPVLIYLYNKDQAQEAIGTSGGGLAQPRHLTIYYTFLHDNAAYTDQYGIECPYVGAHELVHVITHQALGHPGTRLMSEGYAVWLDGSYGRRDIEDHISAFHEQHPDFLLTPTQLLQETVDAERIYYPNAGMWVRFATETYGIDKLNQLFTVSREQFIKKFKTTGISWSRMESDYDQYLQQLKEH